MYDAVLISPHYHYSPDGRPIPADGDPDYQNLAPILPLGILHVAQYLHDCGLDVRVVHLPQEMAALRRQGVSFPHSDDPVKAILKNYPARVCGIQAHFVLYSGGALHVAETYKALFPDSGVWLGGYMASAFWREYLAASTCIDGIVIGEGERTFRTIVDNASPAGHPARLPIGGIAYREEDGTMVRRPMGSEDLIPLQAMPVIDPGSPPFRGLLWPSRGFINIARGLCPETCAYCVANDRSINPRPYRTMTIDRIIEQLHLYRDHGTRGVFLGETQFLDMPFMTELVERLSGAGLDLYFELETHPAVFAQEGLLTQMIRAGFHRFTFGGESGSEPLLNRIGRRASPAQLLESVKRIAAAGGLAVTSWICNLPGETASDAAATRQLLDRVVEAGGFIYWIENLHVLPGSRLYRAPESWHIDVLLKTLADWIRWSLVSKRFVEPETALASPLDYLTHRNQNDTPQGMMARFFDLRRLARDRIPEMKTNVNRQSHRLPPEVARMEIQRLDWYAAKGWKLLLF